MPGPSPQEMLTISEADDSSTRDQNCFHTVMAHLYRGEMHRLTVWRTRLDTTSQWAILVTTGITTFTLGAAGIPHYIMLLSLAINTMFMIIEGRRYRHLHHSKWRIKILEHHYFANLLSPENQPVDPAWRTRLASDLRQPVFSISLGLATRLRLRRNYLMLLYFTTAVWLTKVSIHPMGIIKLSDFYARLAVGDLLPSWFVAASATIFIATGTILAVFTPDQEALENTTSPPG